MVTFAMMLLTIMTVGGAAIIGWLSRYWWTARQGVDPATLKARNLGVAIGTVAVGTAAMRYDDDASQDDTSQDSPAGIAARGAKDEAGQQSRTEPEPAGNTAAPDDSRSTADPELAEAKAEVAALRARLGSDAAEVSEAPGGDLASTRAEATALRQKLYEDQASGEFAGNGGPSGSGGSDTVPATAAASGGTDGSEADSGLGSGAAASALGNLEDTVGSGRGAASKGEGEVAGETAVTLANMGKVPEPRSDSAGADHGSGANSFRVEEDAPTAAPARVGGAGDGAMATTPSSVSSPATPDGPPGQDASGFGDDLTAIRGIGSALQDQLNARGIASYADLAALSPEDQAILGDALGFTGRVEREDWVAQARDLMDGPAAARATGGREARLGVLANAGRALGSLDEADNTEALSEDEAAAMRLIESGEFVADDSNRPAMLLDAAPEGGGDDLKVIKGVGPKLEGLLHGLGIYRFSQIAAFSATDIAWVDSKLSFKGRIVRDRWVDQARDLASGAA